MAMVRENFPDHRLTPADALAIQGAINTAIDTLDVASEAPQFVASGVLNGALMIHCANDHTVEWLNANFNGKEVGGMKMKILKAADLPKPVKMALKSRDILTTDGEVLLRRLARLNPGLNTDEWRIREKKVIGDRSYIRWIIEMDQRSAEYIRSKNFEVFTGIFGKGLFKIIKDLNAPRESPSAAVGKPLADSNVEVQQPSLDDAVANLSVEPDGAVLKPSSEEAAESLAQTVDKALEAETAMEVVEPVSGKAAPSVSIDAEVLEPLSPSISNVSSLSLTKDFKDLDFSDSGSDITIVSVSPIKEKTAPTEE